MRVSLGRTVLYVMLYLQHVSGQGLGRAGPHNRSVSYPMRPAQLQTDTQNRHTTQFFFGFQDRHGGRPDLWSTAAAKQQQQGLKHDITLESQKTNKQTWH